MGQWTLVAMLGFAGLGVLVFLRLVSNEVALRIRAMHLRMAADEAEAERTRPRTDASSDVIHDVEAV